MLSIIVPSLMAVRYKISMDLRASGSGRLSLNRNVLRIIIDQSLVQNQEIPLGFLF